MIKQNLAPFLAFAFGWLPLCSAVAQVGSPAGPVPVEFLETRRQQLLELLDGNPALVFSAGPRGPYAQASDYREDNNFFYLTGIEGPAAGLFFNGSALGEMTLYLPDRDPRMERWTGAVLGPDDEARALTGLNDVRSFQELEGNLRELTQRHPHDGSGSGGIVLVSFGDPAFEGFLERALSGDSLRLEPLEPLLHRLRLVKDDEELRRLRKAVEITSEAHREVWRMAEPGVTEYQVEAALEYVFHVNGAERVGFTSIVGSGPNSVVLHYDENRGTLEDGDLVVVDIGAEFGYYTADLTRTFPANGQFSPRQAALYDLVLGARAAALEAIRPGGTLEEVNRAARGFLRDHSGDLCGPESCAAYLLHGVSHWLGMDVHDVGSNRSPLQAGMVLTLEPGLYLADESLGIRIEDDILVTESGYEVLSGELPLTRADIEAIMRDPPAWVR